VAILNTLSLTADIDQETELTASVGGQQGMLAPSVILGVAYALKSRETSKFQNRMGVTTFLLCQIFQILTWLYMAFDSS
jgi:hypothetical protein